MSLFAELKRRNVLKVTAAYLALAWLVTQVTATVAPLLHLPEWIGPVVVWIGVIGLPFVVTFSWIYQLTPEGLRRDVDRPAESPAPGGGPGDRLDRESLLIASDHSIAVLPFANMSDDQANEHFADGLSEELLNLLCRIPELRVVARTSSFSFKGRAVSAATIARKLNVAHLLEGSVRKSGSRLRITAQLIRASDSSHVWSRSFDRDLSDVFAVQDEIAASVVSELQIKLLGGAAPKARSTDPDAYVHYLKGKHFLELASAFGYEQAIASLESAIAIDPRFGPAWATLGALYWGQANNLLINYQDGSRRARTYSEKALALDPELAEPMSLLGYLDVLENVDVEGGSRRVAMACQLEPHNQRVLTRAANIAIRRGNMDEAIRCSQQALQADPLSPNAHAIYGNICYYSGRLEEAEAMRRRVLELSPGWLSGYYNLGKVLLARNDAASALTVMQQEPSTFWRLTGLALTHHALGQVAESDAALQALMRGDLSGSAIQLAQVHAYRGEVDSAFEWLDRAVAARDSALVFSRVDPLLENLRGDPRWASFLSKNGLAV